MKKDDKRIKWLEIFVAFLAGVIVHHFIGKLF